ncbi:MAG: hypothetical protein PVG51_12545 [Desulfosarcina sp.]|jgi:hypothetical protein
MTAIIFRTVLVLGLAAAALMWKGDIRPSDQGFVATAEAVRGRPATPVSYAGVARRTTVRVATPGVGAPGAGVAPGNRGGPVNRVGVR